MPTTAVDPSYLSPAVHEEEFKPESKPESKAHSKVTLDSTFLSHVFDYGYMFLLEASSKPMRFAPSLFYKTHVLLPFAEHVLAPIDLKRDPNCLALSVTEPRNVSRMDSASIVERIVIDIGILHKPTMVHSTVRVAKTPNSAMAVYLQKNVPLTAVEVDGVRVET
jgi:hypothetical protein